MKIKNHIEKIKRILVLLRFAFSFFQKDKIKYGLGIILNGFECGLLFAVPYINKLLVQMISKESGQNAMILIFAMFVIYIFFSIPVVIGKYLQNTTTARAGVRLKEEVLHHICMLPMVKVKEYDLGDYATCLTDDANKTVGIFTSYGVTCLIRFTVVLIGSTSLLFANNWKLAIASLVYCLCSVFCSVILNPRVKKIEEDAKKEIINSSDILLEEVKGYDIAKIFDVQDILHGKYMNACRKIVIKRRKFRTLNGISYGIIDFLTYSAQGIGFVLGIILSKGNQDIANAVYNASLFSLMADAMLKFSVFLLLIQPLLVSAERVYSLMQIKEEKQDTEIIVQPPVNHNEGYEYAIQMKNINFGFGDGKKILNDFCLSVKKEEHIAIIGESGCGKTTVFNLLEKFYEPDEGEIVYFDKKHQSIPEIRKMITYISQDCVLFDGTVEDNIRFGREDYTKEEFFDAVQKAGISSMLSSFPDGFETKVGEQGNQLSGGQKQRIAIARAFLKDAPVLLMDEATASLDAEAEEIVETVMEKLYENRTVLMITHKLNRVKEMDRIIVMDKGYIVEEGTFEELLDRKGYFYSLYIQNLKKSN